MEYITINYEGNPVKVIESKKYVDHFVSDDGRIFKNTTLKSGKKIKELKKRDGKCAMFVCVDRLNRRVQDVVGDAYLPSDVPCHYEHVDKDYTNNTKDNIIRVEGARKKRVEKSQGKCSIRGYYFDKRHKKYMVRLVIDGQRKIIGSCDTPEEAAKIYQEHKKKKKMLSTPTIQE